jgi:hypothetical protein
MSSQTTVFTGFLPSFYRLNHHQIDLQVCIFYEQKTLPHWIWAKKRSFEKQFGLAIF